MWRAPLRRSPPALLREPGRCLGSPIIDPTTTGRLASARSVRGPRIAHGPVLQLRTPCATLRPRRCATLVRCRPTPCPLADPPLPQPTRWPGCSAAHYGGDWHRLYRCRASLPPELPREADRFHALTARASDAVVRLNSASVRGGGAPGSGAASPSKANVYGFSSAPYCNMAGMLLDEAMQAAFTVGLALAGPSGAARRGDAAAEVARFRRDAAWWLANRPEVRGGPSWAAGEAELRMEQQGIRPDAAPGHRIASPHVHPAHSPLLRRSPALRPGARPLCAARGRRAARV